MTIPLIAWPLIGLLTHIGITFLDRPALDLHIPRAWRTFAIWVPLSMLCGPLMLIGVLISPPRLPWED